MIISIPSVIIAHLSFISLWGGSIRFNVPMLLATAFLPMFGDRGVDRAAPGFQPYAICICTTRTMSIAHFHYVVAPGRLSRCSPGIYYKWFPKMDGPAE